MLLLSVMLFCVHAYGADMSLERGKAWYAENKEKLMNLQCRVLQTPEILRVEPGLSIRDIPNGEKFTPDVLQTYNELLAKCNTLSIKNIAISRKLNSSFGQLISVRYVLDSGGLSVSGGKSLSINFVPDDTLVPRLFRKPEDVWLPLDEKGWYVVDYQEGRK